MKYQVVYIKLFENRINAFGKTGKNVFDIDFVLRYWNKYMCEIRHLDFYGGQRNMQFWSNLFIVKEYWDVKFVIEFSSLKNW